MSDDIELLAKSAGADGVKDSCPHCDEHKRYAIQLENQVLPVQDVARFYEAEFNYANERAKKAEVEASRLRKALELIAEPMRPDGTYNRDRMACELLAREALASSPDKPVEFEGIKKQEEMPLDAIIDTMIGYLETRKIELEKLENLRGEIQKLKQP